MKSSATSSAKALGAATLCLTLMGSAAPNQPAALTCAVEVPPSDEGSGRIGDVAVGPGGRLAWTDGRPGQVMVRDARRRVRAVGRSGAGPGEFRLISTLGWWGDTLWVGDASLPRVQFFTDSGAFIRGVTALTRAAWAPRPNGALVGFAPRRLAADLPFAYLRQRAQQGLDTLASWPLVPAPRFMLANGGPRGNPQPFAPETVVGASPDHSTFCGARPEGDAWQLDCVDDASTRIRRTKLSFPSRRLTDALFDSMVVVFSQGRDKAEVRRQLARPKTLPAINDLKVANNGDVWLQRSHGFDRPGIWQRVTREGLEKRELSIAPLTRLLLVSVDSAWGTRADADGLESLLRCAIPPR